MNKLKQYLNPTHDYKKRHKILPAYQEHKSLHHVLSIPYEPERKNDLYSLGNHLLFKNLVPVNLESAKNKGVA